MGTSNKFHVDIIKSPRDSCLYRGLVLENGLKVVLISDPNTKVSAAALNVNVGYLSDPDELPGLAHFCEHMLFLGTGKYPAENDYRQFLTRHGGASNAFTRAEETCFYFTIASPFLFPALDRFAQFFLDPLFTESATRRELNAVHSEYVKNLHIDVRRILAVQKLLAKEGHPYRKFSTGNIDTLWNIPQQQGIDTREAVIKFHSKWYSANIMSLAVYGQEGLDELEEEVINTFCDIVNKNVQKPSWPDHPYGPDEVGKILEIVPVRDTRTLSIIFPIPDQIEYYKNAPGSYWAHLIGHEGKGSLLAELKRKGWATMLSAGVYPGATGFSFFKIALDLSSQGFKKTDQIVLLIFQYLNMLREGGMHRWIYNEIKDQAALRFRFKPKATAIHSVKMITTSLQFFPMEECISATYLLSDYDPDVIRPLLSLLQPNNMIVRIVSKDVKDGRTFQQEHYYGAEYYVSNIPADSMESWSTNSSNEAFVLPTPNPFIPSDFDLVELEDDDDTGDEPKIVHNSALLRIWYMADHIYRLPFTHRIEFCIPSVEMTPLHASMTSLLAWLFKDSMTEITYFAKLAGLGYNLYATNYGMILAVSGYSHRLLIFMEAIICRLLTFKATPQRFFVIKDLYLRRLQNFKMIQPHSKAIYFLDYILAERAWSVEEILGCTHEITLKQLNAFISIIFDSVFIEGFVYGNISREKACDVAYCFERRFKSSQCLLPCHLYRLRLIELREGSHMTFYRNHHVHKASCTLAYYQAFQSSVHNNVLIQLVHQIIREPAFTQLRTREQLGYIVHIRVVSACGVKGLAILVQSERPPEYLDLRIEALLAAVRGSLEDMSAQDFQKHIESLAIRRLEKPKTMRGFCVRTWSEIYHRQYFFDRAEQEVSHLRTLQLSDIVDFFDRYLSANSDQRRKLSIYIVSAPLARVRASADEDHDGILEGATLISNVHDFKAEHGLFPRPTPHKPLESFLVRKS
ncbi:unnamed protein product [Cyprideis torosa]|uniref:Uncharacterized protein n=1 Tax=Cyprideis torosa TaxID=163714 RepID=A0A7R8W868_9CRUS|nr:unnamed protein product [Cyprideis torosa]CAG0887164.1 unnamed protein product [Cyprideis torosa]